jgi:TPR repeat protein
MRRILTGLVLILMLTGGASAGPFEDGAAVSQRGDYATALRAKLGFMYDKGQGVPQDYAEAVKWYRLAADQGLAAAQLNLGFAYGTGRGVPQDYAEAVKWYRLAAEQGLADAQFNLGIMYKLGKGVPQDYAEAVKWYRLGAEQGNARAQLGLGVMYGNGKGVPQNYVQAHMWFNLAAARFPASDAESMNQAVQDRDLAASRMTPEQIGEAQKLAREWKPK